MPGETAVETPAVNEPVTDEKKELAMNEENAEKKEEKKDEEKKEETAEKKEKACKKEKVKKEKAPPPPNVHKKDFEKDVVYLYQFGRTAKVPSTSPYCLKVESWLKFHGIKYEVSIGMRLNDLS